MNTALAFLAGAILTISGYGHPGQPVAPGRECHIKFASYGFTGTPGTAIRYHGESYVIPAAGHLELVAHQGEYAFEAAGIVVQLTDETPRDEFGSAAIDVDHVVAEARALSAAVQVADAGAGTSQERPTSARSSSF
jgi:hypothetical protein